MCTTKGYFFISFLIYEHTVYFFAPYISAFAKTYNMWSQDFREHKKKKKRSLLHVDIMYACASRVYGFGGKIGVTKLCYICT